MQFVVFDAETYYDKEYTLSKLSTEAYVRDARFDPHGAAIKWSKDHAARWYDARFLPQVLKEHDWFGTFLISHHAQFDHLILSHHYGVHPKMSGCTLSMFRMLLGNHLSVGLDPLRKHFGMPAKRTPYERMIGRHWHEMDEATRQEVAEGACDEVESIWNLFELALKEGFPVGELEVVDLTVKMFTEPVLRADVPLLRQVWEQEEVRKVEMRQAIQATEAQLQSAALFCQLLEQTGIEVVYKKGKNGDIPAIAKTDEFMRELQDSEDPYVRALAEARLGAKSTLIQSRAERLGFMAQRGPLCVYIKYAGTHSIRFAGGDGLNWQNMPARDPNQLDLRRSVQAPPGYLIMVIDSKQIQCRMLNYLAGEEWVIEVFRDPSRDLYAETAGVFYKKTIDKKTHPLERYVGKKIELGCQFGQGWRKFQRLMSVGADGPRVVLTDEEAQEGIDAYRSSHRRVCAYWSEAGNNHSWLAGGLAKQWGPMEIRNKKIYMPDGTFMIYDTMEWHQEKDDNGNYTGEDYWRYRTRRGWTKTYGAAMVENCMQALERCFMVDIQKRLAREGLRCVNVEHDKLALLVREDGTEDQVRDFCVGEFKREVAWLPGMPLDADWYMGERYEAPAAE